MLGPINNRAGSYRFLAVIFMAVFLFGFVYPLPKCRVSAVSPQDNAAYQKQSAGIKLTVSVKKKTKKSSIKASGKTGKYFALIVSVNGQEKARLTANKKGKYKVSVPLDFGINTITVQASNGTETKTVSKNVRRTGTGKDISCLSYNQFSYSTSTNKFSLSTIAVMRSKSECDLISQKSDRSKEIVSDHNSTIDSILSWENNCLFHSLIYTAEECLDISRQNKTTALVSTLASINNLWGTDRNVSY